MRVVLDVEQYHKIGSHCLTTCLATLFRKNGINMPEENILGLGSGLGFTYVRQKEGFVYGGRAGNIEINLMSAIGSKIINNKSEDKDVAWLYNKSVIANGHPLICDVDMSKLSYMVEKLNTQGSGFSGHKLLLIGFDDEAGQAYVLDYLWSKMIAVKISEFKNAASSSMKPMSPDNSSLWFDIPYKMIPFEEQVFSAISYNVNQMKNPVGFGLGLKAMKRFFKEIKLWPSILSEERLRYELNMSHMVFEKIGTGGGNFRRMYSRFLKNCGEKLCNETLRDAARIYAELGRKWKKVAYDLYHASIDKNIYSNILFSKEYNLPNQILEMEEIGIKKLERYLEGEMI